MPKETYALLFQRQHSISVEGGDCGVARTRFSSIQELYDVIFHVLRTDIMVEELDDSTLTVEEVLGEVPFRTIPLVLLLKVLVERAFVLTNDFTLGKERKFNAEFVSDPLFDLLLRPGFLVGELVAGHGKDNKSTG